MGEQLPSILQANELSWFSTTGPSTQRFLYNLFFHFVSFLHFSSSIKTVMLFIEPAT